MKRIICALLAGAVLMSTALTLAACTCEMSLELSAPTGLRIEKQVAYWNRVSNASGYVIRVGENQARINDTHFDLSTLTLVHGTTYQVSVQAVGQQVGDIKYIDSSFSLPISYIFYQMDGYYFWTTSTVNGQLYTLSDNLSIRALLKLMTIMETKAFYEDAVSGFDANDLSSIRNFFETNFPGMFNFIGINTAEEFWSYFYDGIMTEQDILFAIDILRQTKIQLSGNQFILHVGGDSFSTTFTLNDNGTLILSNLSVLGADNSVFKYVGGKIVENEQYLGMEIVNTYSKVQS